MKKITPKQLVRMLQSCAMYKSVIYEKNDDLDHLLVDDYMNFNKLADKINKAIGIKKWK